MYLAADIAARLAANAEEVARMLLPAGKKEAGEWVIGSTAGEPGKSLKIRLAGQRAGKWADFATDQAGDMLDLWAEVRGLSIGDAMRQASDYLGLQPAVVTPARARAFTRPSRPAGVKRPDATVAAYLQGVRKLSQASISAYQIASVGTEILFPYKHGAELFNIKHIDIHRRERDIAPRQEKNAEPGLFGWQAIDPRARAVTICEGEIDALSLFEYGYPALSVPMGGGGGAKQSWIEHEFDRLARFDTIYLCLDSDEPGETAAALIADRLARHRCQMVVLPAKDANDCLQLGVPQARIRQAFDRAQSLDPAELKRASEYWPEVWAEFYPPAHVRESVIDVPWPSIRGQLVLRPGDVTLLGGFNAHGKSQLLGHLAVDTLAQGRRVCAASLEFHPRVWLRWLATLAMRTREPTLEYHERARDWFGDNLFMFDAPLGARVRAQRLLEVFEYAARRYRINFFIVDNLSKLLDDPEDYKWMHSFMNRLTTFASDLQTHVVLVAHSRKRENEHAPPGKMDFKGSGVLTDLASNVLVIWRNLQKEESGSQADPNEPDAQLRCLKQRHGGTQPSVRLWFDKRSGQYLDSPHGRPTEYIAFSNVVDITRRKDEPGEEREPGDDG
jgi:twinkle protein